jgi:hypothetical protein
VSTRGDLVGEQLKLQQLLLATGFNPKVMVLLPLSREAIIIKKKDT